MRKMRAIPGGLGLGEGRERGGEHGKPDKGTTDGPDALEQGRGKAIHLFFFFFWTSFFFFFPPLLSRESSPSSSSEGTSSDPPETEKCAICLQPQDTAVLASPCLHSFCAACLHPWLAINPTCPLCKSPLSKLIVTSPLVEPLSVAVFLAARNARNARDLPDRAVLYGPAGRGVHNALANARNARNVRNVRNAGNVRNARNAEVERFVEREMLAATGAPSPIGTGLTMRWLLGDGDERIREQLRSLLGPSWEVFEREVTAFADSGYTCNTYDGLVRYVKDGAGEPQTIASLVHPAKKKRKRDESE
jgi:hypothetical protein